MPWAHWSCSVARLLVVAGLAAAGCGPEAQQPRVPGAPRPIAGTPSNSKGEELYKSEDYAAAAWVFEQLVAGPEHGDRERAQFWLGKSYFQLDDFERAAQVFLSIVAAPEHEHRTMAFPWLLALRRERPGDVVLLRTIGKHGRALLEDESFAAIRDQVLIAVGEDRLRTGHTAQALALLQQVTEAYDSYGEAQLLAGLAAERLGRRAEAIERLSVAATWGAPTRRERRSGQVDAYEDRIRRWAARELERLGQPLSRR